MIVSLPGIIVCSSEVGILTSTAHLAKFVKMTSSPLLLQQFVHFILGDVTSPEKPGENDHKIRQRLIERCDHLSDEASVYLVEICLKNEVHDKFILRLPPSIKSCWIYSIFVEKKTTPVMKPNFNQHFDVESINNLLASSAQLSSKAEKFKASSTRD